MTSLLAEELMLLCWDEKHGRVSRHFERSIDLGLAAALVLDALGDGVLRLEGGRLRSTGSTSDDPLVVQLVDQVETHRGSTLSAILESEWPGDVALPQAVMLRLVDHGVLSSVVQKKFGLFPTIQFDSARPAEIIEKREAVLRLLTGRRAIPDSEDRAVLVAGVAGAMGIHRLVPDRSERRQARDRATELGRGIGFPSSVQRSLVEAMAPLTAALRIAVLARLPDAGSGDG